jgi:hypothetical protein
LRLARIRSHGLGPVADVVDLIDALVLTCRSNRLWLCDAQGLIGREMFAIDGVKLPANASGG